MCQPMPACAGGLGPLPADDLLEIRMARRRQRGAPLPTATQQASEFGEIPYGLDVVDPCVHQAGPAIRYRRPGTRYERASFSSLARRRCHARRRIMRKWRSAESTRAASSNPKTSGSAASAISSSLQEPAWLLPRTHPWRFGPRPGQQEQTQERLQHLSRAFGEPLTAPELPGRGRSSVAHRGCWAHPPGVR